MGKSSSQPSSQTVTNKVELPAWLDSAAQSAVARAQDLSQRDYVANPNPQVAPQSSDQQQAYAAIRSLQGGTQPFYGASETALGGGGLLGMATPITAGQVASTATALMNPYTEAVIDPAVTQMRQGLQTNLQQIAANANAAGAYGGTRQGVEEGVARAQEAIGEGQLTGGLLSSGWNTALQTGTGLAGTNLSAALTTAGLLPQIASAGQTSAAQQAGLLQTAGTAEQQQQQAEYDATNNAWYAQQNWPVQNLDLLLSSLSSVPYGSSSTSTQQTQNYSNPMGNVVGGAALGSSVLGTLAGGAGSLLGGLGLSSGAASGIGALAGGLLAFI